MARKLKTYQTSLGFYDLAIAAPSMKAALEAWGAGSNLFHQGFAKETDDPDVVAATMAKPGVVLKRPAGSSGKFAEHSELPDLGDEASGPKKKARRPEPKRRAAPKVNDGDAKKAAAEFEREQKLRDAERRKEEAVREKERAKREKAIAKAQGALDAAQREHEERSEALDAERRQLEKRVGGEDARWEGEREKLKDALRRARE
ncbi:MULTISPECIES: cell envelope biogenesis protein TolA [unclassified Bradyrhizobium]|uniref:cell envelope biogenesis protein TolA n=1 Tax=unclassified Bradyrhizobium TaxID=2631580 RepID=UPI0033913311